jgi:hypothetical protein
MLELRLGEFNDSLLRFGMRAQVFSALEDQATACPMVWTRHPLQMDGVIHLVTERCTTVVFSYVCEINISSELEPHND